MGDTGQLCSCLRDSSPVSADGLRADLERAAAVLEQAGVPGARSDAELLAAHAAGTDRSGLQRRLAMGEPWPDDAAERFEDLVGERARRVPLQHLTGRAPFRRLELRVGPGVFVPRPETEVVAGLAIDATRAARDTPRPVVVDLCTGSGAIAVAVATEVPGSQVAAVELSAQAHAWAVLNVAELAPGLVDLRLGDASTAFEELLGGCDVVVSNPPYVPVGCVPVDPEVADHDPALALFGGADGLDVLRAVASRAADLLRPGGVLVLEHGEHQASGVARILGAGWTDVAHHSDLTGRPRGSTARRAAPVPA